MEITSHETDEALKRYWLPGGRTREAAQLAITQALSNPPGDPFAMSRALGIIDLYSPLPSAALERQRVGLTEVATCLRRRCRVIDQIGQEGVPVAVLYDYLGDSADQLTGDVDAVRLDSARLNQPSRPAAARAVLGLLASGDRAPNEVQELLTLAASLASRTDRYQANALFACDNTGLVLGVRVVTDATGVVKGYAEAAQDLDNQARLVLAHAMEPGLGASWTIEWPSVDFEGESIGLGVYVAATVACDRIRPDPLLACTGRIEVGGMVLPVGGIEPKLRAAAQAGIQRVLLAEGNRPQATAINEHENLGLHLIFVTRTAEIRQQLAAVTVEAQPSFAGQVRFVRSQVRLENVRVHEDAREQYHRFWLEDLSGRAFLDVYRNGTVTVQTGPDSSAREAARRAKARIDGPQAEPRERISGIRIPEDLRERVKDGLLEAGGVELPAASQYELWRVKLVRGRSEALLIQYTSGKLDIPPGSAPAFDIAVAAIRVQCPGLGGVEVLTPKAPEAAAAAEALDQTKPHIGTDEAGKGDYFGPLVSAAVFVDEALASRLKTLGVRDSKTLGDTAVRRLAAEIRGVAEGRYAVTTIQPQRYNTLYAEMRSEGKNLNTLLAWAHTRSIEDLIRGGHEPVYVISDQFGDRRYIEQKLLEDTRRSGVLIIQQPKAEMYIAVAAASVLARDGFLDWMEKAGARLALGKPAPKGVSPAVEELAREIHARGGEPLLREYVKLSFKTTEKVIPR